MASDELVSQLAAHTVIGAAPRAELEWLAAHGQVRTLEAGEILSRPSEPVGGLYIILSDAIAVFIERAGAREKVSEWHGGEVSGLLPYSRLQAPPGDVVALDRTGLLAVLRADMPALIQHCPAVTTSLVHVMLDRTRHFTSTDLLAEKMMSLGKLSAGLAHELNNPASAIARSARALREAMRNGEEAARVLGALPLNDGQLAALDELRNGCLAAAVRTVRSPLGQADREAAFGDWLAAHGADPAPRAVGPAARPLAFGGRAPRRSGRPPGRSGCRILRRWSIRHVTRSPRAGRGTPTTSPRPSRRRSGIRAAAQGSSRRLSSARPPSSRPSSSKTARFTI